MTRAVTKIVSLFLLAVALEPLWHLPGAARLILATVAPFCGGFLAGALLRRDSRRTRLLACCLVAVGTMAGGVIFYGREVGWYVALVEIENVLLYLLFVIVAIAIALVGSYVAGVIFGRSGRPSGLASNGGILE